MKSHDPRQRRGGILAGAHKIPSVGQRKVEDGITFQLAEFKFHPPVGFDQVYAMMMMVLASGVPAMYKVVSAFGGQFRVHLAEDCELGKKHDLVLVTCDDEGLLSFMVAKPVADDPSKKN